ncbi:Asp-tRNA(Asn)/Glu-tRNA(Gln) amidotransferase subunit GatC [Candidatus Peregrinibacteria bacterium]|nr:Asp-tRNA(Asn)/Glu-tRNA(Gln) amidotransferase subunit GatC [Candidatus Peregrinibacteria bacterium]
MKLTPEQVRHIAQLARLKLNDEEVEKFSHELTDILDWVEMLNEVDTEGLNGEEGVPETSQVTGLTNVLRADTVVKCGVVGCDCDGCGGGCECEECSCDKENCREELLECTELPVERKQIKVKPVL